MDYDGTIHDWDGVFKRSLNGVLGLSGEEFFDIWTYRIHRGIIHQKYLDKHDNLEFHCQLLFEYLGESYDEKISRKIIELLAEAQEKAKTMPEFFPDAIQTLRELNENGYTFCLSTGTGVEQKAETMKKVFEINFFSYLFSEPLLGYLKTEPEYYLNALQRVNVTPEKAISVGDTPLSDIRPAKLVNMRAIWLNRRGEKWPNDVKVKPDFTVNTLLEVISLLSK
jgi:putative hydrolase of the HAD superfamily